MANQPQQIQGKSIGIIQSNEQFAEIKLADGATISFKACIVGVIRLDQDAPDGSPQYAVATNNVVQILDVPADLRGQH